MSAEKGSAGAKLCDAQAERPESLAGPHTVNGAWCVKSLPKQTNRGHFPGSFSWDILIGKRSKA
jgi:hypothetical protein